VRGPMNPILSARLAARADFPKSRCGAPRHHAVAGVLQEAPAAGWLRGFLCAASVRFSTGRSCALSHQRIRALQRVSVAGLVKVFEREELPYLSIALRSGLTKD